MTDIIGEGTLMNDIMTGIMTTPGTCIPTMDGDPLMTTINSLDRDVIVNLVAMATEI